MQAVMNAIIIGPVSPLLHRLFLENIEKIKKILSNVLNTFENIMENGAFAPKEQTNLFTITFSNMIHFKGVIME